MVGSLGTIINLSLLAMFTEVFGIHYLISALIATLCAFIFNYFINTYWTYRDAMRKLEQ